MKSVTFKGADGWYSGQVVRETAKLFYYVQLNGWPYSCPPVKVPKSKCKVLKNRGIVRCSRPECDKLAVDWGNECPHHYGSRKW